MPKSQAQLDQQEKGVIYITHLTDYGNLQVERCIYAKFPRITDRKVEVSLSDEFKSLLSPKVVTKVDRLLLRARLNRNFASEIRMIARSAGITVEQELSISQSAGNYLEAARSFIEDGKCTDGKLGHALLDLESLCNDISKDLISEDLGGVKKIFFPTIKECCIMAAIDEGRGLDPLGEMLVKLKMPTEEVKSLRPKELKGIRSALKTESSNFSDLPQGAPAMATEPNEYEVGGTEGGGSGAENRFGDGALVRAALEDGYHHPDPIGGDDEALLPEEGPSSSVSGADGEKSLTKPSKCVIA